MSDSPFGILNKVKKFFLRWQFYMLSLIFTPNLELLEYGENPKVTDLAKQMQ